MSLFIGKAIYLIFNRRTISRTKTSYSSIKHRRTIKPSLKISLPEKYKSYDTFDESKERSDQNKKTYPVSHLLFFVHFRIIQRTSIHSWRPVFILPASKPAFIKSSVIPCEALSPALPPPKFYHQYELTIKKSPISQHHRLAFISIPSARIPFIFPSL
jgi:hypothetical protein